ncbi:hypothetical protein PAAG_12563 [Paracoccidioides lutzii Pb01]|uniref:Uncharacterized protein n=1 Tax=Paracoccidioides lutzii (strain ATCC MYA-826 / Pb01) TaxID=502779 RepID=A0A0A2UZV4_PARBA|nr:hypothetical protein PAAG_12563 [Paracoccidioides lutzii Pb01]KGQ00768.1 hypothetical protein PAAG_12563 [Paracoccidioides lutzii Pb01]
MFSSHWILSIDRIPDTQVHMPNMAHHDALVMKTSEKGKRAFNGFVGDSPFVQAGRKAQGAFAQKRLSRDDAFLGDFSRRSPSKRTAE